MAELVAGCGTRVYPVGRLDLNSEGLLLMTNDGALTQKLTHPSSQIEKEYLVRVTGDVERALPILRQNMKVDGEAPSRSESQCVPEKGGNHAALYDDF